MIATTWKVLLGGVGAYLALALWPPLATAEPRTFSYETLLAIDDPAKTTVKPATGGTSEVKEEMSAGLDNETPAALQLGGAETAPVTQDVGAKVTKPDPDDEEDSVFKKWWFWTLAAGIVGSTVALGVWAAQPEDSPARPCTAGALACFGDGRN